MVHLVTESHNVRFPPLIGSQLEYAKYPFSIVTGMLGTLTYGLSLRNSSLIILFFTLIACVPPAYLSTLGPKTGLRMMVTARYSFGFVMQLRRSTSIDETD